MSDLEDEYSELVEQRVFSQSAAWRVPGPAGRIVRCNRRPVDGLARTGRSLDRPGTLCMMRFGDRVAGSTDLAPIPMFLPLENTESRSHEQSIRTTSPRRRGMVERRQHLTSLRSTQDNTCAHDRRDQTTC